MKLPGRPIMGTDLHDPPYHGDVAMRFVLDRWYVVPVFALVALYVCSMLAIVNARAIAENRTRAEANKVSDRIRAQSNEVYRLAKDGNYVQIRLAGLASDSSIDYLRMQSECFGRVTNWVTDAPTPEPSTYPDSQASIRVYPDSQASIYNAVRVVRPGITLEEAVSEDGGKLKIELGADEDDLTHAQTMRTGEPISDLQQALARGREIIHFIDASENITSITAKQKGQYWLITEIINGTPAGSAQDQPTIGFGGSRIETRYLVLSREGLAVEHVRERPTR